MADVDFEDYITVAQAAARYQIPYTTIITATLGENPTLPCQRAFGTVFVRPAEVEKWNEERPKKPGRPKKKAPATQNGEQP